MNKLMKIIKGLFFIPLAFLYFTLCVMIGMGWVLCYPFLKRRDKKYPSFILWKTFKILDKIFLVLF